MKKSCRKFRNRASMSESEHKTKKGGQHFCCPPITHSCCHSPWDRGLSLRPTVPPSHTPSHQADEQDKADSISAVRPSLIHAAIRCGTGTCPSVPSPSYHPSDVLIVPPSSPTDASGHPSPARNSSSSSRVPHALPGVLP